MPALKLTPEEAALVRAAEDGQICNLPGYKPSGAPIHTIRSEALRRLVLGLPVILPDDEKPLVVAIGPLGVRVCNAEIEGLLDLNDASGARGESLPPLVLTYCRITEPVWLCRARFRHLSFAGSELIHLCGLDLKVEGSLDLSDICSSQTNSFTGMKGLGQCWVELCGARIEGELRAPRSHFVAQRDDRSYDDAFKVPRYALDLRNSKIDDGLDLYPDLTAIGGISLYLADIGGDLTAYGASLEGKGTWLDSHNEADKVMKGSALNLCGARVKGTMRLEPYMAEDQDTRVFRAVGPVRFHGAHFDIDVILSGAEIDGTVDFNDVTIEGDLTLGIYRGLKEGQKHDFCTVVKGYLGLFGAKISKDLILQGLTLGGRLNGTDLTVGRNILMNARTGLDQNQTKSIRCVIGDDVILQNATIGAYLLCSGADLAGKFSAVSATFHSGLSVNGFVTPPGGPENYVPFRITGEMALQNVKVFGALTISAANLEGGINLNGAKILGDLSFGYLTTKDESDEVTTHVTNINGPMRLRNAQIDGETLFQGTKFKENAYFGNSVFGTNLRFEIIKGINKSNKNGKTGNSCRVIFKKNVIMYSTKIFNNLEMDGVLIEGDTNGSNLSIGGSAFFNSIVGTELELRKLFSFEVTGLADFIGLKVSGQLQMKGAAFHGGLNLGNSTIGGALIMAPAACNDVTLEDRPMTVGAKLNISNSKIGNANLAGLVLHGDISLRNSTVEGPLFMGCTNGLISGKKNTFPFMCSGDVDIYGARVQGDFNARGADIEGYLDLGKAHLEGNVYLNSHTGGAKNDKESNFPFKIKKALWAIDCFVGHNLRVTSAQLTEGMIANRLRINGDLNLDKLVSGGNINLNDSDIHGSLTISFKRFKKDEFNFLKSDPVNLGLRNARVGEYDDFNGTGLRERALLDLEGFHYGRLSARHGGFSGEDWIKEEKSFDFRHFLRRYLTLPVWAAVTFIFFSVAIVVKLSAVPYGDQSLTLATFGLVCVSLFALYAQHESDDSLWKNREKWLRGQYTTWPPLPSEYKPGAYERLAEYFHKEGFYKEARKIASTRLTLERKLKLFWLFKPVIWIYWACFDYGLSPVRALMTFFFCVLLGAVGTDAANGGAASSAYVRQTNIYMSQLHLPIHFPALHAQPSALIEVTPPETACHSIDPALYALDVFLPAVDLHQESQCTISGKSWAAPWRFIKAFYAILGWLITSLTILTISGILRRQAGA